MPYLTVTYTSSVKFPKTMPAFLADMNRAFSECESVKLANIKSSAMPIVNYCVAGSEKEGEYVDMNIRVLPGRSKTLRAYMIDHMLGFLKRTLFPVNRGLTLHVSVQLEELNEYQCDIQLAD